MQALESSRLTLNNGSATIPWGDLTEEDFCLGAIGAGSLQAFERLCHRYYGPLAHFLSLLLPATLTRELCEEILAEVWTSAGDCPQNLTALTFVLRIGLRQATALHSGNPAATGSASAEIRRKLGELQWEQRVVATLVYGLGLPSRTISQITTMSDQEISGHLTSARQLLRPQGQRLG
jgi:DNA-directed RNA polymerase specialized sigma24 family protein